MLTLIFDIDGTLTCMWPIERAVLLAMIGENVRKQLDLQKNLGINELYSLYCAFSEVILTKTEFYRLYSETFDNLKRNEALPSPQPYNAVQFIKRNPKSFRYVYATGGIKAETEFVLDALGIKRRFDLLNSTSKDNCKYPKRTGIPFQIIQRTLGSCCLISDSETDMEGAVKAGIPAVLLTVDQELSRQLIDEALAEK